MSETTIPIPWFDPIHRSLGHLAPDIIVRRGRSIHIVDAKYKFHLAELDRAGWHRFTEEARAAHRADVHQVLAYAALYDAEEITATLVYPLRRETWNTLVEQQRDRAYFRVGPWKQTDFARIARTALWEETIIRRSTPNTGKRCPGKAISPGQRLFAANKSSINSPY